MNKFPEQLYVTAKEQLENSYDEDPVTGQYRVTPILGIPPLGFLNAYEPGKASFEKKKATQHEWTYRDLTLYQIGSGWGVKGTDYDHITRKHIPFDHPLDPMLAPQVWDNVPLPGFKILKSVSRMSTSNKLWRILDPRGIQFEISTAILEQIIDDATILKGGKIDAKCAWMNSKNLVVVV